MTSPLMSLMARLRVEWSFHHPEPTLRAWLNKAKGTILIGAFALTHDFLCIPREAVGGAAIP